MQLKAWLKNNRKVLMLITALVTALLFSITYNLMHYWGDDDYKDRVWLHRTNTLNKLKEFEAEYDNFECDIVFRKDSTFDVTHDVEVTNQENLESYFQYIQGGDTHLWLDIKNLTCANQIRMFRCLDRLRKKYHISRSRLIVESRNWEALALFTQNGYYTSCYLDIPYQSVSEAQEEKLTREIEQIAASGNVKALSFFGKAYPFMDEEITSEIDFLTWEHQYLKEELPFSPRGRKILKDHQVKVILVKDRGHYHK